MQKFEYKAKDRAGKDADGIVEALSIQSAARLLQEQSFVIISLKPQVDPFLGAISSLMNQVEFNDVAIFTRQFSTMITSGLPITDALVIARSQCKPAMKPVVNQILSDVEGGTSLAVALEKYPKVFSSVYISLIRAGEEGGILDQVLGRLADNMEKQKEFRSKVKGVLIYPAIVILGIVIVAIIMMIFVVPKLTNLYSQFSTELPLPTRVLIAMSTFMVNYWWLIVIFLAGFAYWFIYFKNTELGRKKIDEIKLKIPIYNALQQDIIITEMARTLGLLVGAGVPILEGLKIISGVVGNKVYSEAIARCSEKVEKGFSLAYSFSEESEIFPPMLYQMMSVGEETGKIDEAMLKVSNIFEQESDQKVKTLSATIEPIVMVILGAGVGLLVIAIILPIYNLTSQIN